MKKTLLILSIGFIAGFLLHALVFPDLFANGIILLPQTSSEQQKQQNSGTGLGSLHPIEQTITYDGKTFSRTNITVEVSRYVRIINESTSHQMDLQSTYPPLTTPRPYGYKEEVRVRMDTKGQFVVYDRVNPSLRLAITVH
jgi:hypothetical protein